jgi:hypothetical protein
MKQKIPPRKVRDTKPEKRDERDGSSTQEVQYPTNRDSRNIK